MDRLVEPLGPAAEQAGAEWVRPLERGAEGVFDLSAEGTEPEDPGITPTTSPCCRARAGPLG